MFNHAKTARGCAKTARKIVVWFVVMMAITACSGSITAPDYHSGGSSHAVHSMILR